uniref:Transposase (putative) YhgA-like domain-containing protein n=1 Tax=Candidatus Kentrum sp. UNK TaxID=2126344 RepID=A0A451AV98_9GAMM|nr:MAG: conserved hypothetical protein (putative transposase or invertase) [Candidatus Kentron sp. UNK]VFK69958.1 MAG: conserved hypothetical protein (putative transposase or invertase) [Candidatus Kentron sp. UNK]
MSHDQNFKNLILDYPLAALEFFAREEAGNIPPSARITPVRQEQLKKRLGDRFRELDTPLLVESPEGEREAVLFIMEEETTARHFSIYRLAHYCLDLAELLGMERVVPVVIFLQPGDYTRSLRLGTARKTYLGFEFLTADLGTISAMEYVDSRNIVARINLPNMRYDPGQRVKICLRAQEGLAELEPDPNKRIKYIDFILQYANLNESEQARYEEYLQQSSYREAIMGPVQQAIENSLQQGMERGMKKGKDEGRKEVAKALLSKGIAIDVISEASGLSEEEIRKLSLH